MTEMLERQAEHGPVAARLRQVNDELSKVNHELARLEDSDNLEKTLAVRGREYGLLVEQQRLARRRPSAPRASGTPGPRSWTWSGRSWPRPAAG